jgi:amino acid transporter
VVTELSTRYPEEGGIYVWARKAFGDFHGFVCGWCYWINNLLYFPSLLLFIVGNAVFIGGTGTAALGENRSFFIPVSLAMFWFVILLNLLGLKQAKWLQNLGAVGTWLPALVLIGMGVSAYYLFGSANPITPASLVPSFRKETLTYWAQMCFAFAGLELSAILGGEIRSPQRNIPRGILFGGIIVALIYVSGTLSIFVALPEREISIVSGVMQAIGEVTERVGSAWLLPVMALLLTLGGLGGLSAWVAGAARIPFVAGLDRYLPDAFGMLHPRYGSPHVAILAQGVISSLLILKAFFDERISEAYFLFVNVTLIVYFVPYLYLFAAAVVLRLREGLRPGILPIPGGRLGTLAIPAVGILATLVSIVLALIPPEEEVGNVVRFEIQVIGGCLLCFVSGAVIYARARRLRPAGQP